MKNDVMENNIEIVNTFETSCNGNHNSGHPLVYFHLDINEEIKCPYCSKIFKQKS